jgi:hypothetical protein
MNFLIVGDSWGYSLPYPNKDFKWLEYNLIAKGNTVYNRSVWGGTNYRSLNDATFFLEQTESKIQIDTVIWYNTCLLRDAKLHLQHPENIMEQPNITYDKVIQYLSDKVVGQVENIRNKFPNIKWCIIGGHAPVYQPEKYTWADFMITDWRSELLQEDVPGSHSLGEIEWLQQNLDNLGADVVEAELKIHESIYQKCNNRRDIFFDSIHPDAEHSYFLSERIARHFNCIHN